MNDVNVPFIEKYQTRIEPTKKPSNAFFFAFKMTLRSFNEYHFFPDRVQLNNRKCCLLMLFFLFG